MKQAANPSIPSRYHSLAISLHWLIALALIFMFASGLYMVNADISKADQYKVFQIHKAAGVLLLLSIVLRVLVRFLTRTPDLPDTMSHSDKRLAKGGHRLLYAAMLLMPLSGWLMVSASPFGLPTIVFDLFKWPHIPWVARNETVETLARSIHWYTALAFLVLIVTHVAAVFKHRYVEKINLLPRMWWSRNNDK